ncbi:MAG: permease [Candidatus Zixiibacteriota bacterium]
MIYKTAYGISYDNRRDCLLYSNLPRWLFLAYEYLIELFLMVIIGVFLASILEKYFSRIKRFIPKNPILAFIYASIIPVCSCGTVPLISALKDKVPFRTIITFTVAAPLLNPYIIMLSASVLGFKYLIIRIFCSFILAVATGYLVGFFYKRIEKPKSSALSIECQAKAGCNCDNYNIYLNTYNVLKKITPYLLIAGPFGFLLELMAPGALLKSYDFGNNIIGILLVIVVGVPVYFCNGADVLFLQPLIQQYNLSLGTAMAFSLTSTSVCLSSLALLTKYIGKKLTAIMLSSIIVLTIVLALLIPIILNYLKLL